jgi:hypothetical protein
MATKQVKMTAWTGGVNNIATDLALPTDRYGNGVTLRDAVNVDVLTLGNVRRRSGVRQVVIDANAHSVFATDTLMIWATPTSLRVADVNFKITVVLNDVRLKKPISYVTVNGRTYFSNENINGIINADGTYEPWGIVPPAVPPTLSGAAGNRQYSVTCTFVTFTGEESGAPLASTIGIGDVPTINVLNIPQSSDPRVVSTRLYVTNIDGGMFYRAVDVPKGQTSIAINGFFSSGATLKTQFMQPPPTGQLLTYNNGVIFIASGSNVFHTAPLRYGAYRPDEHFYMYPERVTLVKAVDDGVYVSSDNIYFLAGATTGEVVQRHVAVGKAIEGAHCDLPNTDDVMFVTDRGFMRATNSGQLKNLTEEQIALNFYDRGALGYSELNGHKAVFAIFDGVKSNPAIFKSDLF